MKKILIVTPYCPFPPHKSGGIHALFNVIKENGKFGNKLDLLYFDEKDVYAETEVAKYVDNIYYLDLRINSKFTRILSVIKGIPYGIYQYNEELLELLDINGNYDRIIFDQPLSMNLINKIHSKESVLMSYDSMSLYFDRKSLMRNINFAEKMYNKIQSNCYKKVQKKLYNKFDKIYFVSENDAIYEKNINNKSEKKIDYITLGVDCNKFDSSKYPSLQEKNVIFTGIMSYAPNKDAAIFFATKIMPEILKRDNQVRFKIVGRDPDQDIYNLENDNIQVTGFVDDIVESITSASVYVSPLRFGTGMKNKVLEAMSCSKAIVASDISVEGIKQLEHEINIYIPTTEIEWVEYVLKALNDKNVNEKFGYECRKIIIEKYNWEKAYEKIFN